MKKFLCYDTNDAASGKINVSTNGVLRPKSTVPSTNGSLYQQLVTDGSGNVKWEDRLAYEKGRKNLLVINFAWIDNDYRIETGDMATQFQDICDNYSEVMVAIGGQDLLMTTNWASGEYSLSYNNEPIIRNYIGGAHPYLIHLDLYGTSSIGIDGNSLGDEATVTLYIDGGVKTIDPKYIKDMYYDNKTVLVEQTKITNAGRESIIDLSLLANGSFVTVNIDGTEYNATLEEGGEYMLGTGATNCYYHIGNSGGINISSKTTFTSGYPFFVVIDEDGTCMVLFDGESAGAAHTFGVYAGEIKQIDPKYIPDTTVKVNITANEDGTSSADKTFNEVKTLIDSGVDVKCIVNNMMVFDYAFNEGGEAYGFEFNSVANNVVCIVVFTRNGLVTKQGPFDAFVLPEVSASDNNKFLSVVNGAWQASSNLIVPSSTSGSSKKFKITVDDSGAITATEV